MKRSINLGLKLTGKRSAGNPHAAFDEAGAGTVAGSRYCDTRQPKGASNGEYKHRPIPARQSSTLLPKTGSYSNIGKEVGVEAQSTPVGSALNDVLRRARPLT